MSRTAYGARQRGAVLFVTLILLVAVMLLVVTMSALSRSNLQIVRNNQSEQQRIALAQRAVEQVLNDVTNFTAPSAPITVANTDGMQVAVSNRVCLRSVAATGYSAVSGSMPPIDTVWNFTVTVSDPMTGGATVITQGARIRMLTGSCV
jgi:Tfp pilus assembly protein PilX